MKPMKVVKVVEQVKTVVVPRVQKVSISYTLKALARNIEKLVENKIITEEDGIVMNDIKDKAVKHWIGLEFNM